MIRARWFIIAMFASLLFSTSAYALPERSLEFCAQQVASSYIDDGVNTMAKLDASGVNGRPAEIIEGHIKELEEKARAAARRMKATKPSVVLSPTARELAVSGSQSITVSATAYCSCSKCCGKSNGITASGAKASWGTIAADTSRFPFGTQFLISGFGDKVFTVQDRGGAIKGTKIDIWFPTHAEALKFGRRTITITRIN